MSPFWSQFVCRILERHLASRSHGSADRVGSDWLAACPSDGDFVFHRESWLTPTPELSWGSWKKPWQPRNVSVCISRSHSLIYLGKYLTTGSESALPWTHSWLFFPWPGSPVGFPGHSAGCGVFLLFNLFNFVLTLPYFIIFSLSSLFRSRDLGWLWGAEDLGESAEQETIIRMYHMKKTENKVWLLKY